ncbi:hypothetical protein [Radiobacillus deserti]|uniref:Uncharacterized protein n=1 Tax=Radiobacillus deserti TaxID=2594883 RepID=A0A516KEK2_9BACI|nr:hypothetical protein [Radiobacillus deserti]QDP39835.1 hypothetical protein FN924_06440 [Radiobacillus deserti]
MAHVLHAMKNGLASAILGVMLLFITPLVLIAFGISEFSTKPMVFGMPIFSIEIGENGFFSEVDLLGIVVGFAIGLLIHFALVFLKQRREN